MASPYGKSEVLPRPSVFEREDEIGLAALRIRHLTSAIGNIRNRMLERFILVSNRFRADFNFQVFFHQYMYIFLSVSLLLLRCCGNHASGGDALRWKRVFRTEAHP